MYFVSRCTPNSGVRPHPLPPLTEITQHRCCFTQITRMEPTINSHYVSPSVSTLFFYLKFESEHEVRNLKIWILPVKTRVLLHRFERVFSLQVQCQQGLGESSPPCRLSQDPIDGSALYPQGLCWMERKTGSVHILLGLGISGLGVKPVPGVIHSSYNQATR